MALYFFVLKHGELAIPDLNGEDLPDDAAARVYACTVARELMQSREIKTRLWRLEVLDGNLAHCFEVHFSEIDETLGHLPPNLRETIVTVARRAADLQDTMKRMRDTLSDAKNTLAEADRFIKPGSVPRRRV